MLAKRSKSSLVTIDAKNWMLGGCISVAVAITFLIVSLTKGTALAAWAPYADPLIVIVIVVFMLPFAAKTTRNAWRQIVGYRPESGKMAAISYCHRRDVHPCQYGDLASSGPRNRSVGVCAGLRIGSTPMVWKFSPTGSTEKPTLFEIDSTVYLLSVRCHFHPAVSVVELMACLQKHSTSYPLPKKDRTHGKK